MRRLGLARVFWTGAAAILVAAALVALLAVLKGRLSDTDGRILISLAVLLYSGGTALAGLALVERDRARVLGLATVAAVAAGLPVMLWGVWAFVFDGGSETPSKTAWSTAIALVALLIATTGALLARSPRLLLLSVGAGALAGLAAALSIVGIWTEPDADGFVKALAALWILAVLGYFLVPVLGRWSSAGGDETDVRVVAVLGDVEVVATRGTRDVAGVEVCLRPGERAVLRPRVDG